MPTVVDSLIVTLGLDPSNFNKGQKEAANAFLKTRQEAEKSGKGIEEASKKAADSISKVTREVLGLYAVFVGARGIKEFIGDLVGADAALGRFSRNLNTSPQTLYAWGAAAERVGGSSEAAAATFERIGKALYDLHRNGQALPKEYSQLQALTGLNIDRDHGIDKFLQDTATALQRLNQIDPSQVHFIAQGMGIDDGTAQVMVRYGAAIGTYIDQLKKLSPQNDAIKAAQDLQEKWVTLQQTAVSLANTVLETLGPELAKLLTQMTEWITQNQDWLKSGIVQGVKDFADYLRSIDWAAVGQGLKDFGNDAKAVADALGGVVRATELLIGIWAGGKVLGMLGSIRAVATGGGGSAAAGTAAGFGLGSLAKIFGVAGAAYALTDTAAAPDMKTIKKSGRSIWDMIFGRNPSDASGHADALQNNSALGGSVLGNGRDGALDAFLNGDTKVDGRPVSKSNPLPVTLQGQTSGGGFWQSVGNFFGGLLGGGSANAAPGPGGSANNAGPLRPTGASAGQRGWWTKDRQQHAYERLTKEAGLSDQGAKGLISRWMNVEASGGPGEVNSIGATGIAQMLGARKRRLYQMAASQGKPVSDYDLQLSHIIEELSGSERKAGDRLRSARTAAEGATGASMYERAEGYNPITGRDNFTGRTMGGMAGMEKIVGSAMAGAALSARLSTISNDNRSTSNSSSHNVSIGSLNVNAPNATDAQGIADRATDALYRSTVAATANYGPR
ncbi:phage tail tip lysozyme [Rhizobium rhizogenes]|uniref:phage tail tip lysozyme n=1 Tax=Rhizobium rhizogenes TaxID=359 RepID=UPI00226EB7A3|nr:phage tail tip lysozyme [Rhizobium rhizogenes]